MTNEVVTDEYLLERLNFFIKRGNTPTGFLEMVATRFKELMEAETSEALKLRIKTVTEERDRARALFGEALLLDDGHVIHGTEAALSKVNEMRKYNG